MASTKVVFFGVLLISSLYLLGTSISLGPDIRMLRSCNIHSIYQLGDSLSDTGNRKVEDPLDMCSKLPYGENFLQEPTGRCSNGLLMIDYIASAAGIPLLNPYLKANANFTHGVNFAVGGCTALSAETLATKNIIVSGTKSSLGVQLEWMSTYFTSNSDYSTQSFRKTLFVVGEIGGNDYFLGLGQGKTIKEAQSMVPEVVQFIKDAVRKVIGLGAIRVIVPGTIPMGCIPALLTMFPSNNAKAYDEHQCLVNLNHFAAVHNDYILQAISTLQEEYPNSTIVYADYYNAFNWLLSNAPNLGIDATSTLKACCGRGGRYSYSTTEVCGSPDVPVCSNPDRYISWDGLHLTQKAYSVLAEWLVADILPKLNCINLQDY